MTKGHPKDVPGMRKVVIVHPECILKQIMSQTPSTTLLAPCEADYSNVGTRIMNPKYQKIILKLGLIHLLASSPPEPLASPPLVLLAALVTCEQLFGQQII